MVPWASSSYKDTSHGMRTHPPPVQLHLNSLYLLRPYFQIRSPSQVLGGHEFGRGGDDTVNPSAGVTVYCV